MTRPIKFRALYHDTASGEMKWACAGARIYPFVTEDGRWNWSEYSNERILSPEYTCRPMPKLP